MSTYTLIGFYPETGQRWCGHIEATDPAAAEHSAPEDVHVVGVIEGQRSTCDEYTHVRAGGQ